MILPHFTDPPVPGATIRRRSYNLSWLVAPPEESGRPKANAGADLAKLKRFALRGGKGSEIFLLDTVSRRLYYDVRGTFFQVLAARYGADLRETDVQSLVAMLRKLGFQQWPECSEGDEASDWVMAVEYEDGSVEQHRGFLPPPEEAVALLGWLREMAQTFPGRRKRERRSAKNIDYLLAGRVEQAAQEVSWEGVERLLFFEAAGPHTVLDHSRQRQKLLLLDLYNQKVYYEPEAPVFENIDAAAVAGAALPEQLTGAALGLLRRHGAAGWQAGRLYLGRTQHPYLFYSDVPAWAVALQYKNGGLVRFSGDGIGAQGLPEGPAALLCDIWNLVERRTAE